MGLGFVSRVVGLHVQWEEVCLARYECSAENQTYEVKGYQNHKVTMCIAACLCLSLM